MNVGRPWTRPSSGTRTSVEFSVRVRMDGEICAYGTGQVVVPGSRAASRAVVQATCYGLCVWCAGRLDECVVGDAAVVVVEAVVIINGGGAGSG